jgi:hypothetical protein
MAIPNITLKPSVSRIPKEKKNPAENHNMVISNEEKQTKKTIKKNF